MVWSLLESWLPSWLRSESEDPPHDVIASLREDSARALLLAIQEAAPGWHAEVRGSGDYWHCTTSDGDRGTDTLCFGPPEYRTQFREGNDTLAWASSQSAAETVRAVMQWGDGMPLVEFIEAFNCVERGRRILSNMRRRTIEAAPGLETAVQWQFKREWGDIWNLHMSSGDRGVDITSLGDREPALAAVTWDGCQVARAPTRDGQLAALLQAWLVDRVPAQALAAHPGLELAPVARYYDEGRGLEGEFLVSWDVLERFYAGPVGPPWAEPFLQCLSHLRRLGFASTLRAGQSMYTAVFSRSRRHGMRPEQAAVRCTFMTSGTEVRARIGDRSVDRVVPAGEDPMPDLIALLRELEATPIS
jgi:hypothetical protein